VNGRAGAAMAVLVGAAVAAAGRLTLRRLSERFVVATVRGASMVPTLAAGQRVLVRRCPLAAVRGGDLVVLADRRPPILTQPGVEGFVPPEASDPLPGAPREPRLMIKRAVAVPGDPVPREGFWALGDVDHDAVPPGSLVVLGDNPSMSDDSRRYGYVYADWIVGRVVRILS
jgi:signal peptidase I